MNLKDAWKSAWAKIAGETISTHRLRRYDNVVVRTEREFQKVGTDKNGKDMFQKRPVHYTVPEWRDIVVETHQKAGDRYEVVSYQKNTLASGYGWSYKGGLSKKRLTANNGQDLFTRDEAILSLRNISKSLREQGYRMYGEQPPSEIIAANLLTTAEHAAKQPKIAPPAPR